MSINDFLNAARSGSLQNLAADSLDHRPERLHGVELFFGRMMRGRRVFYRDRWHGRSTVKLQDIQLLGFKKGDLVMCIRTDIGWLLASRACGC